MILSRVPKFVFGLVYGAIVNTAVLGIVHAFSFMLYMMAAICRGCSGGCMIEGECWPLLLIVGGIILAAGVVGLVVGIVNGLTRGTWHCAMDFYNNGFVRGLSSPFRFLSAEWSNFWSNDKAPLAAYYASTDMGVAEKQEKAKQLIEDRSEVFPTTMDQMKDEQIITRDMPKRISQIVSMYEISLEDLVLPDSQERRIAHSLEYSALEQEPRIAPLETAATYFSGDQAVGIVRKHSFFHESNNSRIRYGERAVARFDSSEQAERLAFYRQCR